MFKHFVLAISIYAILCFFSVIILGVGWIGKLTGVYELAMMFQWHIIFHYLLAVVILYVVAPKLK